LKKAATIISTLSLLSIEQNIQIRLNSHFLLSLSNKAISAEYKSNPVKKISFLIATVLLAFGLQAQAPQKFSYQSVIRNSSNQLVVGQTVGIKISILQGSVSGNEVFAETHLPLTNANGLATLEIGGGSIVSGNFANINWANGPFFVKTETDPNGGSNYTITNTSQLLSVPYALYASSANTSNVAITAGNGVPAGGTNGQVLTNCNGVATWTTAGQCPEIITSLNCSSATNSGSLTQGVAAVNVSSSVPYTGGSGGAYSAQTIASTGVTGLTATLAAGNFATGAGALTFNITGTPVTSGTASFTLNIGGQNCTLSIVVNTSSGNPISIETVLIPAGTFTMGSPLTEPGRLTDEVQHQVTLSAYRMSKYETSNAQFATYLNARNIGSNGEDALGAFPTQPLIYENPNFGLIWTGAQWQPVSGKENFPVVNVTWYGAREFATFAGGRLPTEAEWEYACRGNTTTAFSTGACLNNTQANYRWEWPLPGCSNANTAYLNETLPLDSFSPNAYGLYNMHGNVHEWCNDYYDDYSSLPQTNPTGPSVGPFRVLRGGGYSNNGITCRSAKRSSTGPVTGSNSFGFRLAFAP
jgi:formylglycine-generating enzyme required for sulfatase activity